MAIGSGIAARMRVLVRTVLLLAALSPAAEAASKNEATFAQWAATVLLGMEYGGSGPVAVRWQQMPTLSVVGATAEQQVVVISAVGQINAALASVAPPQQLRIGRAGDDEAKLVVVFAPLRKFPALAAKFNFYYVEGNWGYFWIFPNVDRSIRRAVVLLASDRLFGDELRHFALEEITQSLGLANDSPYFSDSIFFASGADGGSAQGLSPDDKRLLQILYGKLKPGDGLAQLQAAIAATR